MFRKISVRISGTLLPVLLLILGLLSLTIQAGAQDSGVTVGPQIDIYTGAGDQAEPHVAFDSINNRFLVAWLDGWPTSAEYNIYGQLVNQDGSLYGATIPISTVSGSQQYIQRGTSNKIAFDPNNQRFLVVWQDNRNGVWNIYGQLVNADGGLHGNNFNISPIPPVYHFAGAPTVQFDTINNRFLVVWVGPSAGIPANIYGQLVNPDGSLHGSMIQITDYAEDYYAAYPDIEFDPNNGRFLVTWGQQYDGNIYGRSVNGDGTLYGSEITIGYYGLGSSCLASLTFDPINSRFLITYNNAGDWIWGQLIDADGTLYGSEFKISDYYTSFPSVVFDTVNNKFLLVGYHDSEYYNGVFGQFLNSDGSLHGSDFAILSGASSGPLDPFVAFGTGAIGSLVVWADWSLSGYDIFGKFVKLEAQTYFEEDDPAITYTGTWNIYTCSDCSGSAVKYSGQTGAKAEFSFEGTGIKWIVAKAKMGGKAKVYLDGIYMGMVDLYSPTTQYQVVLQKTGLSPGTHIGTIEVSGQKNPSSTGYYIDIDAFEVVP